MRHTKARDVKGEPAKAEEVDYGVPLGQAGYGEAEIKAQIERLTHSPAFGIKARIKRLLECLVRKALAGKTPTPQDVAQDCLGMAHLDRGAANVRNNANRLRDCLEAHYASGEAMPSEIRLALPPEMYVIHAPKALDANASSAPKRRAVGIISEPAEGAEVYYRTMVHGRIDALDADLRLWLVIEIPVGILYPEARVTRNSTDWKSEIRIGLRTWGTDEGARYIIHLVAAGFDGDVELHQYMKSTKDGFGRVLPSDCTVLYSRQVTRRDIRDTDGDDL